MPLIAGLLAIFVCIGLFAQKFDKRAKWLVFVVAIGIALYITWR